MRTLRVLHVTPYSADAWAYGGIPRVVGSLARGLARRGHHVTVCATDVCDEVSRLPRGLHTPSERIRVRMFPNISNTLAYRFQLYLPVGLDAYLKEAVRSFDIAHIHACRNLPGVIAARRLRQAGVPYVLAPHGTAPNIECWPLAKRVFDVLAGTRVLVGRPDSWPCLEPSSGNWSRSVSIPTSFDSSQPRSMLTSSRCSARGGRFVSDAA